MADDASPSGSPGNHVVADQGAVFAFLADPAAHGLPAGEHVTRIDTHGAAVFLAGPFAYKVKRAVLFPFMDFSTLEKRRAACSAEVEISGAGAPGLYLGVVPIVRRGARFALGGDGEAVEHAVKMRRFDTALTLDKVAERGALTPDLAKALARTVAAAHAAAPVKRGFDTAGRLASYLADNEREFAARPDLFPPGEAQALSRLSQEALARVAPLLATRSADGFARRCHGDMHLRNIVLIDGAPTLFDAIEFNDDIATCDVLYDLAFLLMDLWQRGAHRAANIVFNRYLWASDDAMIDGLAALPLFLSLRAAIRAKVEAAGLGHLQGAALDEGEARVRHAFAAALGFLAGGPQAAVRLVAVGGLSGSGKSTWAAQEAPALGRAPGAAIVRSDIERKRVFGIAETERLTSAAYAPAIGEQVYARIRALAARVLATGQSVIVDAVHARPDERAAVEAVARAAGVPFEGVWLEAPAAELVRRVETRTGDASDADAAVVRKQLAYELGEIGWRRKTAPVSSGPGDPSSDQHR
ncbi:AAA family ATPase [Xanthobacter tagetidis]|uniref:Aminoglycoside phosphotransferase n=1 Tax=Xanthobacter tagetidis TaxID=60216 RepID=A0A3L6ZZ21_9HYPH|nr:AAA family ATPase [Xanthobacter tagetidis]MBB6307065.1 hypothetical protein [Xanthobacter tagetidis]RLP73286.1 aminoglycoside phosphotransferase [Xanthobacter tagetidis]